MALRPVVFETTAYTIPPLALSLSIIPKLRLDVLAQKPLIIYNLNGCVPQTTSVSYEEKNSTKIT